MTPEDIAQITAIVAASEGRLNARITASEARLVARIAASEERLVAQITDIVAASGERLTRV